MEKQTPLQKRIKRHITGRIHSFFIAVTPGLEVLCLEELSSLPLSATATHSRLYHKDAIDEKIRTAIADRQGTTDFHPVEPLTAFTQKVFVRVVEDRFGLSKALSVINKDFFDMNKRDIVVLSNTTQPGLVIINPPYGIRLGTRKKSRTLFRDIIKKLGSDFQGWRYALFVHDRDLIREIPFKKSYIMLDHGGLKLALTVGRV